MISERRWRARLFLAVGAMGSASVLHAGCNLGSSCGDSEPARSFRCFSKAELAQSRLPDADVEAGSDAGGTGMLETCPSTAEIAQAELSGAMVDRVQEDGDRCCYRFFYPCEGRPLLISDEPSVAPSVLRGDWCDELPEPPSDLGPRMRDVLAEAWSRDAAFEHASIASFSAFIAQLLALGAPLELVHEAQRALSDEVRHAKLCYSLASRYAGRQLGPGPLEVPAFSPTSLHEAALATFREGCIAETIAAHGARERLARTSDLQVVRALARIVEDEQRHAELAWRFVRWALDQDPAIAPRLAAALGAARAEISAHEPERSEAIALGQLHAHGQSTSADRSIFARTAFARLIEPCTHLLLSAPARKVESAIFAG
jgi:hypothetical protein